MTYKGAICMPPSDAVGSVMADFASSECHQNMGSSRRTSASRCGQIAILYCWLMVIITAVLAITLNLAGMFTYHAHLQTSTDLSVYSAAVMQARELNNMARANDDIVRELRRAKQRVWGTYANRSAGQARADSARRSFESFNQLINRRQREMNERGAANARREAVSIARSNQAGLGPVQVQVYPNAHGALMQLSRTMAETQEFGYRYKERYTYWVSVPDGSGGSRRVPRTGVRIKTDPGPSVTAYVYEKGSSDLTYFTARLLRPFQEFMFTWGGMWPEGFEELRTYATAMPYGGRLWDGRRGRSNYDVKLVRTGDVYPRPPIPDAWGYDW